MDLGMHRQEFPRQRDALRNADPPRKLGCARCR
jgi:hypothetical protein